MGETRIKWIHVFNLMLGLAVVVILGVMVFTVKHFKGNPYYTSEKTTVRDIEDDWYLIDKDGIMVPFTEFGSVVDSNEVVLTRLFIFDNNEMGDSLCFRTSYSAVEVYQDEVLIYSYGDMADVKDGTLNGVYHCVVPIEVRYGECSEIEVRLYSHMGIRVSPIQFGSAQDIITGRFSGSLLTIIFSVSLVVIAIAMGILAVIGKKRLDISGEFFYFPTFLLLAAVWAMTDIQILSTLGIPAGVVSILSYESFALMALPFMIFMYYNVKHFKAVDLALIVTLFVDFIAVNVLHFSKIVNFAQSVMSTQILVMCCVLIVIVQLVIDFVHEKSIRTIMSILSLICIIAGAVMQFVDFHGTQDYGSSEILQIGIILFAIIHVMNFFSKVINLVDEGRKAEDYLSLSRTDSLTGLGNRRGLDVFISEISKSSTPFYRLGCIVCDLNDLKKTNDVYGHDVGDRLIKDFANCLQVCFENRGKVFRTGGDEFYILFSDVEVDMSAMMRRLTICLDGSNSCAEYKISCSRGCYADYVAANNEDAVWDIIKFADAEMYKMKNADREKRRLAAEAEAKENTN